jgi:hypothetical protein
MKFSATLNSTTSAMIAASTGSPTKAEITLAIKRMMTSGLEKKERNWRRLVRRRAEVNSFGPN